MQNIFEFTPNLIGILGSSSLSDFKLKKKIEILSKTNFSLIEVNDIFIIETYSPWFQLLQIEQENIFKLLNAKNVEIGFLNDIIVAPKKGIQSPWASKVSDIFSKCGIEIKNIEKVKRYRFSKQDSLEDLDLSLLYDPLVESVITKVEKVSDLFTSQPKKKTLEISNSSIEDLSKINESLSLGLNDFELAYLYEGFKNRSKTIKDSELMMFSQINSEHCRHKIFNSQWINQDSKKESSSLFSMIKDTYKNYSTSVLSAYSDNAAVIEGYGSSRFFPQPDSKRYKYFNEGNNFCIKVETHNHPTAIAPFPGAATGSGGEIRDEGATGIGAKPKAGLCGFSVSNLRIPNSIESWEGKELKPDRIASPLDIMIEGPIGAASFNNEFGRPNILGYFRSFEKFDDKTKSHFGFHKPIMIAGGLGNIRSIHTNKKKVSVDAKIVVIGGPGYLIGLGGGSASSTESGNSDESLDFASVQRSNPEMQRRCQEVIDQSWQMGHKNPISFIHDVGAGGLSNALPELINDCGFGAEIDFSKIPSADQSMSDMEIWCNESQERYVLAVEIENFKAFEEICKRENCPYAVVGNFTEELKLLVKDPANQEPIIDLGMKFIFGANKELYRERIELKKSDQRSLKEIDFDIQKEIFSVLRHPTVARKNFLITIGDRNVGGLTFRDQMIGPLQIPVSDNAITLSNYGEKTGEAMAMGEKSPVALINPQAAGRLAITEAVLNLISSGVTNLSSIKLSANWMASPNNLEANSNLFETVKTISQDICKTWNLTIPVGKDSLSMETQWKDCKNTSPESLIISAFAPIKEVNKSITPMMSDEEGLVLARINFGSTEMRLGGSILSQVIDEDFEECPDIEDIKIFPEVYNLICEFIKNEKIIALHDISDGGLIASVIEMMFASNLGVDINFDLNENELKKILFSEEPGLVMQLTNKDYIDLKDQLNTLNFDKIYPLGKTNKQDHLVIKSKTFNKKIKFNELMKHWSKVSSEIKKLRDNPKSAEEEKKSYLNRNKIILNQTFHFEIPKKLNFKNKPNLAVIREQGVNGQIEMAAAFEKAGFEVTDLHMSDLINKRLTLNSFQGIIFPGGFSFGDVLGAGRGWANSILMNSFLKDQFEEFFNRTDTFSFGVCNGCQVMSNLKEIIPGTSSWPILTNNDSGQFEARLTQVKIHKSKSLLFDDMQDSHLLIPVAHGEGKMDFTSSKKQLKNDQVVMSYVDANGRLTEDYPNNPNGTSKGITSVCSEDGRATIMMPHPERAFLNAQLSWTNLGNEEFSPWIKMFLNARKYF